MAMPVGPIGLALWMQVQSILVVFLDELCRSVWTVASLSQIAKLQLSSRFQQHLTLSGVGDTVRFDSQLSDFSATFWTEFQTPVSFIHRAVALTLLCLLAAGDAQHQTLLDM